MANVALYLQGDHNLHEGFKLVHYTNVKLMIETFV